MVKSYYRICGPPPDGQKCENSGKILKIQGHSQEPKTGVFGSLNQNLGSPGAPKNAENSKKFEKIPKNSENLCRPQGTFRGPKGTLRYPQEKILAL